MTREQKTKICEHFDWLHTTVSNVPDDLKDVLKAAYLAGAAYALNIYCPHWISVDEELPPIFPLNPNESMNVITYGLHTMVNWYDYERGEWVRDSEITHWMPLPQPPHHFADVSQKVKKGGDE